MMRIILPSMRKKDDSYEEMNEAWKEMGKEVMMTNLRISFRIFIASFLSIWISIEKILLMNMLNHHCGTHQNELSIRHFSSVQYRLGLNNV